MCDEKSKCIQPVGFKNTLAYINPVFAGNSQNDAAFCVSTILSEIHNELNSISPPKPCYNYPPDANQLGEVEAAK